MNAFSGQTLPADALERVKADALVPILWDRAIGKGVEYTHRGVDVVYILEFSNGLVKVGQSIDFETRVSANCSNRRVRGHRLMRFWRVGSSAPLTDEATLIRMAGELGGVTDGRTREWFTGVDGTELIAAAERELVTAERGSATKPVDLVGERADRVPDGFVFESLDLSGVGFLAQLDLLAPERGDLLAEQGSDCFNCGACVAHGAPSGVASSVEDVAR